MKSLGVENERKHQCQAERQKRYSGLCREPLLARLQISKCPSASSSQSSDVSHSFLYTGLPPCLLCRWLPLNVCASRHDHSPAASTKDLMFSRPDSVRAVNLFCFVLSTLQLRFIDTPDSLYRHPSISAQALVYAQQDTNGPCAASMVSSNKLLCIRVPTTRKPGGSAPPNNDLFRPAPLDKHPCLRHPPPAAKCRVPIRSFPQPNTWGKLPALHSSPPVAVMTSTTHTVLSTT